MNNVLDEYLFSVSRKFSREQTSEYGYRTELETILKEIFGSGIKNLGIDHDPRTKNHNKPDFVVLNGEIPILYLEAKDIGANLDKVAKSNQMSRYFGYDNLVLTDYLEFRFFRSGLAYGEPIKIATFNKRVREITPLVNNYDLLISTFQDFPKSHKEKIKSGSHLAKIMGGKAQRIRDNVEHLLANKQVPNKELLSVYQTIKTMLVTDLDLSGFADMYAQTLVYGLFVARYYDSTNENFSRAEARDLIPASNPFLRQFFDHIAGTGFPRSLSYIVDELCLIFRHSNVHELMETHLDKKVEDPVIHFYEDFLQEYDPTLKKKMGAYYTPLPVVDYIVRSVDSILRKEFGLVDGLADTSKLPSGEHRVQILDPATGTGTFISRVIGVIHEKFKNQTGMWPTYVHRSLLPRLFGFELMMTPYTIAHLRLSMAFKKTDFKYFNKRLGIYLTNSLENEQTQNFLPEFGLAGSIAEEAREANKIKNNRPIMVVIGNPPYSGESSNKTSYAKSLVEKYKKEPGGVEKLKERNPKWINDDYVKFIAFAQDMIDKNGSGIVAFITNNGFLDNPTFRGMRWHLRNSFDKIFILDLHGNAKKRETAPDGSKDENVFDIMQGVSIMLAVKTEQSKELAKVFHSELFGLRASKFDSLRKKQVKWKQIFPDEKMVYFVPKNEEGKEEYERGIALDELMPVNSVGIVTGKDDVLINDDVGDLLHGVRELREKGAGKIAERLKKREIDESFIERIAYRPFDIKNIYYDTTVVERPREKVMKNMLGIDCERERESGKDRDDI